MKYIVMLCDGMADYPVNELNGKTPMMVADKINMDTLVKKIHCRSCLKLYPTVLKARK